MDEKVDESLKGEVDQMMKEVQNDSMKEVKGLEDRLYGLDQIISGARKIVQEQAELAQVILHLEIFITMFIKFSILLMFQSLNVISLVLKFLDLSEN